MINVNIVDCMLIVTPIAHSLAIRSSGSSVSATGVALGGFTEEDETLFRSMATNICTVIQRAELDVEVRARRKQTQALLQLSEISSTEFGVKKAMQRILRAASTAVDAGTESDTSPLIGISQWEMNAAINRSRLGLKNSTEYSGIPFCF